MPYKVTWQSEVFFDVVLEPDIDFPVTLDCDTTQLDVHFNAMKLGWYIRHLRTKRKLSIRDVCKGSGLSTGYMSQIETKETDRPPSMRVIKQLAEYFGIGTDTLLLISGIQQIDGPKDGEVGTLSTDEKFSRMVLHECLQPEGLESNQLKWLAPEWKRLWVEHSRNLVRAIQAGEELPEWLTADDGVTP